MGGGVELGRRNNIVVKLRAKSSQKPKSRHTSMGMVMKSKLGWRGRYDASFPSPELALIDDHDFITILLMIRNPWFTVEARMEDSQDRPAIAVEAGSVNGISLLWSPGTGTQ